jgi:hypothetical protein
MDCPSPYPYPNRIHSLQKKQDMRYFFVLLVFLLCSFGLTFSVLLSTPSDKWV